MNPHLWALPGPAGFLHEIAYQLKDGNSVIVLGGEFSTSDLESACGPVLTNLGLPFVVAGPTDSTAFGRVIHSLCGADERVSEARDLFQGWDQGGGVWLVDAPAADARRVAEFMRTACIAVRTVEADLFRRPRLLWACSETMERARLPREAGLSYVDLEDHVSSADVLHLVKSSRSSQQEKPLIRELREQIILEIARGDLRLAEGLLTLAIDRLLTLDQLDESGNPLLEFSRRTGCLGSTSSFYRKNESRPRRHSISLALCRDSSALNRRIWRAVLRVVFPWLEEWRVMLIHRHRAHLTVPWRSRTAEICDRRDLELTDLAQQARGSDRLRAAGLHAADLAPLVILRNDIAHLRVPSLHDLAAVPDWFFWPPDEIG